MGSNIIPTLRHKKNVKKGTYYCFDRCATKIIWAAGMPWLETGIVMQIKLLVGRFEQGKIATGYAKITPNCVSRVLLGYRITIYKTLKWTLYISFNLYHLKANDFMERILRYLKLNRMRVTNIRII